MATLHDRALRAEMKAIEVRHRACPYCGTFPRGGECDALLKAVGEEDARRLAAS